MKHHLPSFLLAAYFIPSIAQAHAGQGLGHGLEHGFAHPLSGMDHLVAMLAVGLWASQLGDKARWAVPATFVGVMILGWAAGAMGLSLPYVETGIAASVLVLGLLIAAAWKLPLAIGMLVAGIFAFFHGHAHGTEMGTGVSGLAYALGFTGATILLHAAGFALGLAAAALVRPITIRLAGLACAGFGVYLLAA